MALKDWMQRKVSGLPVWKRKGEDEYIYVTWHGSQGNVKYDIFRTTSMNRGGSSIKKNISTETKAKVFAKAYMRKH